MFVKMFKHFRLHTTLLTIQYTVYIVKLVYILQNIEEWERFYVAEGMSVPKNHLE